MGQEWVEVTVRTSADPAEVLSRLNDSTVPGVWQDDGVLRFYWPATAWDSDRLIGLRTVLTQLGHPVEAHAIVIGRMADKDWNEPWARAVQPLRLGRVIIRPSWHRVDLVADEVELIIDPKQAFGTGHHATTQLLIEWLQEAIAGGERVLDFGTGSGILAMVALRLGAGRATGIDYDPVAIDYARDYAAQNGFGEELSLKVGTAGSLSPEEGPIPVHLVLANLDRQGILDCAGVLAAYAKRGARLLLSGLLAEQVLEVKRALEEAGIYVLAVREREGWTALDAMVAQSRARGEEPEGPSL